MVYKVDLKSNKIYRNNVLVEANSILLGRFEGSEEEKENILHEGESLNLYKLFLNNSGNYAVIKLNENDDSVSIIAGSCISVYYLFKDDYIYFSDLMIDIENLAATSDQMDLASVYYYIASGNYPPLENTFWKNIHKISGEHHVKIFANGQVEDVKWTFMLPGEKCINKKEEYEEIINFEAAGIKNWLKASGKKPYCLVSGVDSFNVFLALRSVCEKPTVIHAKVDELQYHFVREFLKEYKDTDFIDIEGTDFSKVTLRDILDSYKESINPFFKMSTDNPIIAKIFERESCEAVEITGDLAGLTMAIKAFNSTLNQYSFYGRHMLGAVKRSYYSDENLIKANERFGKKYSLYNFMTSMFLPTENFDALVPFKSLKKAAGLDYSETQLFISIVHKYIGSYANSVRWDNSRIYAGDVGKLFRSFKREFYMPALPVFNEFRNYLYGISRVLLFSSCRASIFEDNYSLDFFNDIYRSKKCVYDYFDAHHSVDMVTLAKSAYNDFRSKQHLPFKVRLANIMLYPVRFIPEMAKNNGVYRYLKEACSFLKKNAGCNVHTVGKVTIDDNEGGSEFIRFSEYCDNIVMRSYFEKLEKAINSKDMMEYSPVEERYVALSVYMKERIHQSKINT